MILERAVDLIEDEALLGRFFSGQSWHTHLAVLKAAAALPLTDEELQLFRTVAGDRNPPTQPVKELDYAAGRRSGKDSIASAIVAAAALGDYRKYCRPGETPLIACIACDRAQSRIIYKYVSAYFNEVPMLRQLLVGEPSGDGFVLANGNAVEIFTNNFRSVRGRTLVCVVLDECAFYRDDRSANPDLELYNALLPGLVTIPSAMMILISSPYRKGGLLYERYRETFSRDDNETLFVTGASRTFNPTLSEDFIDKQIARDPQAAVAEWLGRFRDDIGSWISRELIDAAIQTGCTLRPRVPGVRYFGFVDVSGMRSDDFAVAIANAEGRGEERSVVLDAVKVWSPPGSPELATKQCADFLKSFGLSSVTGDRYGGEWPVDSFKKYGIRYEPAGQSKSELYLEALPLFTSGRVNLLDIPKLTAQLANLERRTARGGRDSIDHPPGAHDDLANSVAGALVLAAAKKTMTISPELLARARALTPSRRYPPSVYF